MKYSILTASILLATAAVNPAAAAVSEKDVAKQYTTVAHAVFQDALTTAENLDAAVDKLVANPSEQTLADAKAAWKAARVPYQQSEVFRFGNTIVDDWEGQLNAWPLDEGLIDYVAQDYTHELGNPGANLNIIASKSLKVGGETLDATNITPDLLASLNELGGSVDLSGTFNSSFGLSLSRGGSRDITPPISPTASRHNSGGFRSHFTSSFVRWVDVGLTVLPLLLQFAVGVAFAVGTRFCFVCRSCCSLKDSCSVVLVCECGCGCAMLLHCNGYCDGSTPYHLLCWFG